MPPLFEIAEDDDEDAGAVHVEVPASEPARSERQTWKRNLARFLLLHEGHDGVAHLVRRAGGGGGAAESRSKARRGGGGDALHPRLASEYLFHSQLVSLARDT